jgi:regulator of protease activity HflC (stomatin/prohibitin superfamily)
MARQETFGPSSAGAAPFIFYVGGAAVLAAIVALPIFYWGFCRIDVPTGHMAVMTRKTGLDLTNDDELAPTPNHKGLQKEVLAEGRHFRNPWSWDWEVVPQVEIPQGKIGVRIRLYGDDPPDGGIIAWKDNEKGIVPQILNTARYAINAVIAGETRRRDNYAEIIELHDPVTVPAGFKGVVTNLSGPMPKNPNTVVLTAEDKGKRGVEAVALDPETYPINPYLQRIELVDCRSQRFNLSQDGDMGFPSKDGFWVTLDGIIEFRVNPDRAAEVFVKYNEIRNDVNGTRIDEEITKKVVLPNARAFCRLRGSDHSGREFISGDTRTEFQEDFQKSLKTTCDSQGIEIIQALITTINPPQQIAQPVRDRQIAIEKRKQYGRQLLQQESEKQLAIETEMNQRKQALVESTKQVIQLTTGAEQAKEIATIEANKRLKVAELELQAAADQAAATLARGTADAKVVEFQNAAEAAGWKKAVEAFGGSGEEFARWTMLKKLAPAYRSMMVNTADSPIMEIFRQFEPQQRPDSPVKTAGGR